jgi:SAM-dependent methyltransferase
VEPIDKLVDILRCPVSGQSLRIEGDRLVTADGYRYYTVMDGIPILMLESPEPTHQGYDAIIKNNKNRTIRPHDYGEGDVAKFLDGMLVPTCGNLFHGVHLSGDYPIPDFDFPSFSEGATILDVGCNWGRWSIAGAKNGYRVVGVDIHLESLLCARHLARKLVPDNEPFFVLADARHLPFAQESFGGAFSYSVIQHFSRSNAAAILGEVSRVMRNGAKSVVQMPNKGGIVTILTKGRTRNSEGTEFDVRYYSIRELLAMFESKIGTSDWYVDCFFGLNVHARDRRFVPISRRWIVDVADLLYRASHAVPTFGRLADSVFVSSIKA